MLQFITPSGTFHPDAPEPDFDEIVDLHRRMIQARAYDRKCNAMQKQGRLATYASFEGQEAAQIGSAAALRPDDWMVATYRDAAAMHAQGYPLELLIAGRTGDERGGSPPEGINVLPPSITVGGHMVHAVGLAWAEALLGRDRVAITYFGDGATSEGDFHEAMNFAAVFKTGCIFLCQNNGWAISMPAERQMASETIAQKADAYGMPGVRVDGNDVAAVLAVTRDAVSLARSGGGPTLIEAVTFRMGPHTTADDPGRYRAMDLTEAWRERDPIQRTFRLLVDHGRWDDEQQRDEETRAAEAVEQAVNVAESLPEPTASDMFDSMFSSPPSHLVEQRRIAEGER